MRIERKIKNNKCRTCILNLRMRNLWDNQAFLRRVSQKYKQAGCNGSRGERRLRYMDILFRES